MPITDFDIDNFSITCDKCGRNARVELTTKRETTKEKRFEVHETLTFVKLRCDCGELNQACF